MGKSLRDRAGGLKPRAAVRLGLSALIPFALLACAKAEPKHRGPVQGAAALIYDGEFGSLLKVCDKDRAIYFVQGSYKAAIGIIEKAPECDGNYLIAEKL